LGSWGGEVRRLKLRDQPPVPIAPDSYRDGIPIWGTYLNTLFLL